MNNKFIEQVFNDFQGWMKENHDEILVNSHYFKEYIKSLPEEKIECNCGILTAFDGHGICIKCHLPKSYKDKYLADTNNSF